MLVRRLSAVSLNLGDSSRSPAAVVSSNGRALAHLYGQRPEAIAISDKRLTNKEAEKIARLIARVPDHCLDRLRREGLSIDIHMPKVG